MKIPMLPLSLFGFPLLFLLTNCSPETSIEADDPPTPASESASIEAEVKPSVNSAPRRESSPFARDVPPLPGADQIVARQFPLPAFPSLEELTGKWTRIPDAVMNRVESVTVKIPVEYGIFVDDQPTGVSESPAGHQAEILRFQPGWLHLSNKTGRTALPIHQTDFQPRVEAAYEALLEEARQRVFRARTAAKDALARAHAKFGAVPLPDGFTDGTADPRFAPIRDYLEAGKLESETPDRADKWLWLGPEEIDDETFDVVFVNFRDETVLGTLPSPKWCLLANGEPVRWIDVSPTTPALP